MNVVIGMAELTLREDLSTNARSYITQIRSSSEALLNTIDDEISLCSIDAGNISADHVEYEPVELMDEIADAIKSKVLEKARVYFSGENLFYLSPLKKATKYVDPEVATTSISDDCTYPYSKTFSIGIDVTF